MNGNIIRSYVLNMSACYSAHSLIVSGGIYLHETYLPIIFFFCLRFYWRLENDVMFLHRIEMREKCMSNFVYKQL